MNSHAIDQPGALKGLKVLDLTRVLAGPVCTMLLADMGAEVIKLEVPGTGDDSRGFPPFKEGESTYFINNNRNKKSIVLNLKDPSDHRKLVEIIKSMDVLVENFRPGTMEKLGLGYDDLKETNSRLIYASISGFGQYGPYKGKPGYDIIGQAMGGIMSITGWPDSPPTRTGTAIADFLSALFCTIGILSALHARRSSGKGQQIDVSIVDSVVTAIGTILQIYLAEGRIPKRAGNKYSFIAPYEAFKAKDGWFVLGVGSESIWKKFCKTIHKEDLIDDKRFTLNADRIKNNDVLVEMINDWAGNYSVNEIIDILEEKGIPVAPINELDQIVNDPHIAVAREMIQKIVHPIAGEVDIVGNPIKMSDTPPGIYSSSPLLGEHTDEILGKYVK
ncbi:MAG TPA: CoA transferase [Deltaproteobacteria bacterium]|nr:CoA transferase [Deltaproteobacteria bacterium]